MEEDKSSQQAAVTEANFNEIKEVASKNIGSMLRDLQDFEEAIKNEDVAAIYRIYKGKLHKELKETSNKNHEIDELLAKKLQDRFLETFPFMKHTKKLSPTMHYYTIDTYYRERPTIAIDASIPEIFVLPQVDQKWHEFQDEQSSQLGVIEQQMDELEAKKITAKTEIEKIDQKIQVIQEKKKTAEESKGLFNRSKADEEVDEFNQQLEALQTERKEWQPFLNKTDAIDQKKNQLMEQYQAIRLNRALVIKEMRLVDKHFGSLDKMNEQLQTFLQDFLDSKKGGGTHE